MFTAYIVLTNVVLQSYDNTDNNAYEREIVSFICNIFHNN
jgi:hypothetical protein